MNLCLPVCNRSLSWGRFEDFKSSISSLLMICLDEFVCFLLLFVYFLLGFSWAFSIWKFVFYRIWEILGHCLFFYFFLIKRNRSLFLQMVYIFCGLVDACMFPRWLSGKESACQCSRRGFDPWVGKSPCRRKWLPTPVFLPGKSHRQRSLVGYSLWGYKTVEHDWACM